MCDFYKICYKCGCNIIGYINLNSYFYWMIFDWTKNVIQDSEDLINFIRKELKKNNELTQNGNKKK